MKCYVCQSDTKLKREVIDRYRYVECGLDNVFLMQISGLRCERCETLLPDIPRPLELHALIVELIVSKPFLLSANEIRFVRTQLGYSQADFAKTIHKDASVLNRIERGKVPVSEDFDRLIRLVYLKEKAKPKRAYDELDNLISPKEAGKQAYRLRSRDGHWNSVLQPAA